MQHIDLSVVQAEREGGILKVEQVRELQQTLSLMPYEAAYRVALLLRFQEANANAQNALLKTLEEAPARVVLLLTADSPESLLPTIASRCEVLRLRPLAVERLESELLARRGTRWRGCWRIFPAGGWATRCACRTTRPCSNSAPSCWRTCSSCWRPTAPSASATSKS